MSLFLELCGAICEESLSLIAPTDISSVQSSRSQEETDGRNTALMNQNLHPELHCCLSWSTRQRFLFLQRVKRKKTLAVQRPPYRFEQIERQLSPCGPAALRRL